MTQLDGIYQSQRLRLSNTVSAAAARAFAQHHRNRTLALSLIIPLVEGAQRQQVALVNAYMTAKTKKATGKAKPKALNPDAYTIEAIRGVPAAEVYGRPWGALGGQLDGGADFAVALGSAQAYLTKTVATDLQLAQTRSAHDWMSGDERIVGYRRVLGGGKNCRLCVDASSRTYRKERLAGIHEHCSCSVAPVFNRAEITSAGTTVLTVDDPELGPRLVAEDWSAAGLPLMPGASEVERELARQARDAAALVA